MIPGFRPNRYITIGGGGSPAEYHVSFARLTPGETGAYLGSTGPGNTNFPVELANGVLIGIDNSNTGGVTGTSVEHAADVTTGIELRIPSSLLDPFQGSVSGLFDVRILAFINSSDHTFLSNQTLPSSGNPVNLGHPSTVDFRTYAENQYLHLHTVYSLGTQWKTLPSAVASAGANTVIALEPSLSGKTITLTEPLSIRTNLTIDASTLPEGIFVSGGNQSRVLEVDAGATALVHGVTFTDGATTDGAVSTASLGGGGVMNNGHLTMHNCAVIQSRTGDGGDGVAIGGTNAIAGGNAGHGGGICNSGVLSLVNCTVAENQTGDGGDAADGTNGSGGDGGSGAGIFNAGALYLEHVTISENHAGQGGVSSLGASGMGGLGGGVASDGTVTTRNCIVAGNMAGTAADVEGAYVAYGTNIISEGGTVVGGDGWVVSEDPLLTPLAHHGGPTPTLHPLAASPAIDAGGATALATDQRGAPRADLFPDIGAVEVYEQTMVVNANYGGRGSLRAAVAWNPPGGTNHITFTNSLSGRTIPAGFSSIDLTGHVVIDASDLEEGVTVSGLRTSRVFRVSSGCTAVLHNVSIRDGYPRPGGIFSDVKNGGGVHNAGDLTLQNCVVANNTVHTGHGGGIFSVGNLSVIDSSIISNETVGLSYSAFLSDPLEGGGGFGGGICSVGTVSISRSVLSYNRTADGSGGGSRSIGSNGGHGGAVFSFGTLAIDKSVIEQNRTGNGGIAGDGGDGGGGGGVCSVGVGILDRSMISSNITGKGGEGSNGEYGSIAGRGGDGGGIYNLGTMEVRNCTISHNVTGTGGVVSNLLDWCGSAGPGGYGAGIFHDGEGTQTLHLVNSTVFANRAGDGGTADCGNNDGRGGDGGDGGGLYKRYWSPTRVIHSTIAGNMTGTGGYGADVIGRPGKGGGFYVRGDGAAIENAVFAENRSAGDGPDIFQYVDATLTPGGRNLLSDLGGSGLLEGDAVIVDSARLAPFNDYGGDTHTLPPLPGSPVMDAALVTTNTPGTDQRGAIRPAGPFPDLGSVEAFPLTHIHAVDSDGDGIDDRLEPAYGFIVGNDDSLADTDGDGSLDSEELSNMTDPTDAEDSFCILPELRMVGADEELNLMVEVSVRTFPGLMYSFQSGSELVHGFTDLVNSSFVATNHVQSRTISVPSHHRYMRVLRR